MREGGQENSYVPTWCGPMLGQGEPWKSKSLLFASDFELRPTLQGQKERVAGGRRPNHERKTGRVSG